MRKPTQKTFNLIQQVNQLLATYGTMTVRQIYYQLVPLGFNYRQVVYILKTGREMNLIDNQKIVDRSRPSYGTNTWGSLEDFISILPDAFRLNYWTGEQYRVEIWTEKDALSQVLNEEAETYRVPVRVTRGFLSTSKRIEWSGDNVIVLYFGDHDPSGLCMDQDLQTSSFMELKGFKRISLTLEQAKLNNLPSIPIKEAEEGGKRGDPRSGKYKSVYGNRCWELDALKPDVLRRLVRDSIKPLLTFDLQQKIDYENNQRGKLRDLTKRI